MILYVGCHEITTVHNNHECGVSGVVWAWEESGLEGVGDNIKIWEGFGAFLICVGLSMGGEGEDGFIVGGTDLLSEELVVSEDYWVGKEVFAGAPADQVVEGIKNLFGVRWVKCEFWVSAFWGEGRR